MVSNAKGTLDDMLLSGGTGGLSGYTRHFKVLKHLNNRLVACVYKFELIMIIFIGGQT